jgi:hypothetical protein
MFIKSVCAWCGRLLSITEYESGEKDEVRISHSICPECKEKVLEDTGHFFSRRTRILARN